jgi:hypothetical protein
MGNVAPSFLRSSLQANQFGRCQSGKIVNEISEKVQKSLIKYLPAGRQGLWNDYADLKCIENKENLFNQFLKSV